MDILLDNLGSELKCYRQLAGMLRCVCGKHALNWLLKVLWSRLWCNPGVIHSAHLPNDNHYDTAIRIVKK